MPEDLDRESHHEAFPRRRGLLAWLAVGFLSIWGFGAAWVVAAFVKPPRSRKGITDRVIKAGPAESLPVGNAQLVRHGSEPIFVVHTDEGALVGLSAVCTHLHCILKWDDSRRVLACPCHRGAFDLNGNVVAGPPRYPLERFRVEIQLGEIYVHL